MRKPSAANADEFPTVYYGDAYFDRHITRLWRRRITRSQADILRHCDDIDAMLRRILYHLELAPVFAYVFGTFLSIPVGQVWFAQCAVLYQSHARYSPVRRINEPSRIRHGTPDPLIEQAIITNFSPDYNPVRELVPAIADDFHPPLSPDAETALSFQQ